MQQWTIEGRTMRQANADEIKHLQSLDGAPHVTFACLCGHGFWTAKNIALSSGGGYNGTRNIFYCGNVPECQCKPSDLVCVVEVQP